MFSKKDLLYAGLDFNIPMHLKRKVYPTNLIALLLTFCVALPFTIISYIYFRPLAIFPFIGMILCFSTIYLNQKGAFYYSRFIISIFPISIGAIFNAYLSKTGEQPIPSIYLIELGCSIIPFVIFDLSEKVYLIVLSLISVILILTFPITNDWLEMNLDANIIRTGWLSNVANLLALSCTFACVYGYVILSKETENETLKLLLDSKEKNNKLESIQDELQKSIHKNELSQIEDKKRNWIIDGINKLYEIVRANNLETQMKYDYLISFIVKYINANQGGFYISTINQNDLEMIKLVSCYAYNRKKHINQEFLPQESGLLGQTYLEKEYIYLIDIPKDYIRITSGLGDANPRSLIILPLLINNHVEGLFEIASFNTSFEKHEIDFLLKASEVTALFVQNNKITEKTNFLLENSQQQSEDLRAQEEEMRQNLEELSAIQDEMKAKENVLLSKNQAINLTLAQIQFDTNGNILNANELFLKTFKYKLEDIQNKHHSIFLDNEYKLSNDYKIFWENLNNGIPQTGEFKRMDRLGESVWLSATYTPILNEQNIVEKILKLAIDITENKKATSEFEAQILAITKSNAIIEFDGKGEILTANSNFLKMMGYELHEIKGIHHKIFVNEDITTSKEYNEFWMKLNNGEFIEGEFSRIGKNQKQVLMRGSYNPILNDKGDVTKIIKYALDITKEKIV